MLYNLKFNKETLFDPLKVNFFLKQNIQLSTRVHTNQKRERVKGSNAKKYIFATPVLCHSDIEYNFCLFASSSTRKWWAAHCMESGYKGTCICIHTHQFLAMLWTKNRFKIGFLCNNNMFLHSLAGLLLYLRRFVRRRRRQCSGSAQSRVTAIIIKSSENSNKFIHTTAVSLLNNIDR